MLEPRQLIRPAIKATIRRASARARNALHRLDGEAKRDLVGAYERAVEDFGEAIRQRQSVDGRVHLEELQSLLDQATSRLNVLRSDREGLLDKHTREAAALGIEPFALEAATIGTQLTQLAEDALRFTHSFIAQDGLQLSDRLWRLDRHAREVVAEAIQSHVIQGHSASQAVNELLSRGERIPADLANKLNLSQADRIARVLGRDLLRAEGSPRANALRLMRTEINRAHGEAYQAAAFAHPDTAGTRFLLSPSHPRRDICDMHARVNRYGLGPGVYPQGRNPWPAHPNTLSFVEVVFSDEITDADRKGKEDRITWLNKQPVETRISVLGSLKKAGALRQGILKENEIATPWNVLKKRYQRRGIDVDSILSPRSVRPPAPPANPIPGTGPAPLERDGPPRQNTAFFHKWETAGTFQSTELQRAVNRFDAPEEIPRQPRDGAYHLGGRIHMAAYTPDSPVGRGVMRHETGHHIDTRIALWKHRQGERGVNRLWSSAPAGTDALRADNKHMDRLQRDYFAGARRRHPEQLRGRRFSQSALARARDLDTQAYVMQNGGNVPEAATRARSDLGSGAGPLSKLPPDSHPGMVAAVQNATAQQHGDITWLAEVRYLHTDDALLGDLAGSITKNRIGRGHTNSYYTARRGWGQQAEAFANVFALMDYGAGFERDYMDALAPNFTRFVRDALKEVIDA